MADVKYQRDTQRLDCLGIDLNRPLDSVKPSRFPYLKNCRSFLAGRIEPRDGLTNIAALGQNPVHSCRRLNDPAQTDPAKTYQRVVGASSHLFMGQTAFTDVDSGYSGNPLALVPWRPDASPAPYMYIADSFKMAKVRSDKTVDALGYPPPPTAPPVALMDFPKYKIIDTLNQVGTWVATSPAATLTTALRTDATTLDILYDGITSSTAGWASITVNNMNGIAIGEVLAFDPGGPNEESGVVVQDVFPSSAATTIASIVYDSDSHIGECSIYLTAPVDLAEVNAILTNSTRAGEDARILSVTMGPDGTTSVRTSTATTWAVGDSVSLQASFRCFLLGNHLAGEQVHIDTVRFSCPATTTIPGVITKTLGSELDLSRISTDVATQTDDLMVISVRIDRPDLLTELRILLDVDATTNDFTRNFYYRAFRPSDITPSVMNLQSTLSNRQTVIQNQIIDSSVEPSPPDAASQLLSVTTPSTSDSVVSQQMETGVAVWNALGFRVSDLVRVGTDDSRSLRNVKALRIQTTVLSTATTPITVDVQGWYLGGGYGPDTFDTTTSPYLYRYRVRNKETNVRSNPSPATRLGLKPYRQRILVTPDFYNAPAGTTIDATKLVLDIERFGGSIPEWHYVGTIDNGGIFIDEISDLTVAGNPVGDISDYQLWPIIGLPVSGLTGSVAGTTVNDAPGSLGHFNTSWAQGTRIIIGDQPYTIYRVISPFRLELVENAGSQNGVSWQIPEPTILAQPLPCLWEQNNVFFACGDRINAGRLYWSNPGSETTTPGNWIDVTSPSEPLMNGLSYNIRTYLFSSENFFQILSTSSLAAIVENSQLATSPVGFEAQKIPNGKGLFSRWALTREPAPVICFVAKDGINATTGGAPIALTDADMYQLFPNEGNLGVDTNGISAPQITADNAARLRLAYYDEYLYFDYVVASGGTNTLVLAFDVGAAVRGEAPGGWFWDVYTPNAAFHYGEEGPGVHSLLVGGPTNLYQYAGFTDAGTPFSMEITTPSRDQNDPRENKSYGDVMVDMNSGGKPVTATIYFNNNTFHNSPTTISTTERAQVSVPCGTINWVTAKNISINLVTLIDSPVRPFFYIWEPRWTFESAPLSSYSWQTSNTTFGMDNFKHIGLCKITHISTSDVRLTFTVDGIPQLPNIIPASGGIYKMSIFRVPVYKGKLFTVNAVSDGEFRLDPRDSFVEVKQWGSDGPYNELRIFGDFSQIEG